MRQRIFALSLIVLLVFSGCLQPAPEPGPEPGPLPLPLIIEPIDLSNIQTEKMLFASNYILEGKQIELRTSQYTLPLSTSEISNFSNFESKIELSQDAKALLQQNGFVVVNEPFYEKQEYITQPYNTLKEKEVPVFITSDSLLHLYHIQFDETLRQIEEREFYDKIWSISKQLYEDSAAKYQTAKGDLKEAYRRNAEFFAVGLELLKPKPEQIKAECAEDDWECEMKNRSEELFEKKELEKYVFEPASFVKEDVETELELIESHQGFNISPIFKYKEDYSQYIPRGHYTRSEKLKNYFKGFMWYGRISFLLKEKLIESDNSVFDAKVQTMGAALIAAEIGSNSETKQKWDRIYDVTAFYVGLSDDLGPYEYVEALNSVFGSEFDPNDLSQKTVIELKAKLAEFKAPKIYGGTGQCQILPPFNPEQADQCLEDTKGFRLMGQRFIPDSYMFQNLVFPKVGNFLGEGTPFTMSGGMRVFPKGLDVMALLGSERAKELLVEFEDSNYDDYDKAFSDLEKEFDSFDETEWNKNLYWAWLFALKPLLKDYEEGYPKFMQTKAWQNKQLMTALASWTELRHDTILYAKQSYTMEATSIPPQDKPVVGYVEPVPEFYNRLLALTRMTNKGLDEMDVLDKSSKLRLEKLEEILERLVVLSEKELANKELEEADYEFIKNFGEELNGVINDVDNKAKKTTIVADVHTDINTGNVLEEGVGYVRMIFVAYKVPDGRVLIGAGPVFSYYEFKQPINQRLTDETWRGMLEKGETPKMPEWTSNFYTK